MYRDGSHFFNIGIFCSYVCDFHFYLLDICLADEFDCGFGYCIDASGECDGFKDCHVNRADEEICGTVNWFKIQGYSGIRIIHGFKSSN